MDQEVLSISGRSGASHQLPSCAALGAISHYAAVTPQALALIDPNGTSLSYGQLWSEVKALSNRLEEAGIRAGERVAVLLPPGALQVLSVLGVLNRHVCLPLQSKTTAAEVETSLRRLSASALLAAPGYEEGVEAATRIGLPVLIASEKSPEKWTVRASALPSNPPATQTEAILFLITSATTDRSKVIPLTGGNLDAGNATTRDAAQLVSSDRLLLMASLCHRLGIESAFAQFLAGGTVIATGGFDPAAYLRWLNDLRPTLQVGAPAVHRGALSQLRIELPRFPISLRLLQSAGAPLPNEVRDELEKLLNVPVLNGYGASEAHYIALEALPFRGHVPNAAGRPCGSEIGIMDSSGELLPAGEEGEIVVRGAAVFSGYLDDADANRRAFQDGWFRTGDLGRLDEHGNLYVTGRLKEMINRGGEKILPGEVDEAFLSHPMVLDAAAFAVPHPTLGEDVACAVVLREGCESPVTPRELRSFAAQRLAPFKVPHRIHFVEQIPRGELGKPQRWMLAERLRGSKYAPPTPAEIAELSAINGVVLNLKEIWERILDRDDLGLDEDFFEAGGDSLAAINMLAEVDRRFGCQTSAAAASFTDQPTLDHLASLVGTPSPPWPSHSDSSDMQIFPVTEEGCQTKLFLLTPEGVEGLSFRRLAKHLQGKMDLSIVRPSNTWYSRSLFSFEKNGAEAAALIRRQQPRGPYFVGGYCFGGIVAVEAARQLSLNGQDVRVILFETLMPGLPGPLRDWRFWMEGSKRQWHRLWNAEHPGLTRNLRDIFFRSLWSAAACLRGFLVPLQRFSVVQRMIQWFHFVHFPLYRPRPINVPLLHILSADEPKSLDGFNCGSRFRWRSLVRDGFEVKFVAFDHYNVLHGSNLPEIAKILISWCGSPDGCED